MMIINGTFIRDNRQEQRDIMHLIYWSYREKLKKKATVDPKPFMLDVFSIPFQLDESIFQF